jgi:hypothetical protein
MRPVDEELEALLNNPCNSELSPAEKVDLCIVCTIELGYSTRRNAQKLRVGKSRVSDIRYGRTVNRRITQCTMRTPSTMTHLSQARVRAGIVSR